MFNEVKEVHLAVDMVLQHISSNRKQSIAPEYIDMALNMTILNYVETLINDSRNVSVGGYEGNQIVYDELLPLKRRAVLQAYVEDVNNKRQYCLLPPDYKHHVSAEATCLYRRETPTILKISNARNIYFIKLNDSTLVNGTYYSDLKLHVNIGALERVLYTFADRGIKINHVDGKFILINDILETFKINVSSFPDSLMELYWERYGEIYKPNHFIIISGIDYDTGGVGYGINVFSKVDVLHDVFDTDVVDPQNFYTTNTEIFKSIHTKNALRNHYYAKNRHLKPLIEFEGRKMIIHRDNTFFVNTVNFEYIKQPTLININTNTMCELKIIDKIVSLTAQRLKAYIKDEGYNLLLNENKTT